MTIHFTLEQIVPYSTWITQADGVIVGCTLIAQALKEIGIPSPGVTQGALIYAGYQIANENVPMGVAIIIAAFIGSACGCSVAYTMGRYLGFGLLRRWGKYGRITTERLEEAKDKLGVRVILPVILGRFVPSIMAPLSIAAGTVRLPLPRFAAGIALAMLLWAGFFVTFGAIFGQAEVDMVIPSNLPLILAILFAALLLCGIAYILWQRYHQPSVLVSGKR
jgi:membrane protein DedA with SNARE-associated domain